MVNVLRKRRRKGAAAGRKVLARKCKWIPLETTAVHNCGAIISVRPDRKILDKHLNAIATHRAKYLDRLKKAKQLWKQGNSAMRHAEPSFRAKITEAKGERAATLHMVSVPAYVNAGYELRQGFSPGTGFDQVWYSKGQDTFLIVEAKGPGATLSTAAAKGDQMSRQWVRNTLDEIIGSSATSPGDRADAKRMRAAMDRGAPPPRVHGKVIEAKEGGGSIEVACPDGGKYVG